MVKRWSKDHVITPTLISHLKVFGIFSSTEKTLKALFAEFDLLIYRIVLYTRIQLAPFNSLDQQ